MADEMISLLSEPVFLNSPVPSDLLMLFCFYETLTFQAQFQISLEKSGASPGYQHLHIHHNHLPVYFPGYHVQNQVFLRPRPPAVPVSNDGSEIPTVLHKMAGSPLYQSSPLLSDQYLPEALLFLHQEKKED